MICKISPPRCVRRFASNSNCCCRTLPLPPYRKGAGRDVCRQGRLVDPRGSRPPYLVHHSQGRERLLFDRRRQTRHLSAVLIVALQQRYLSRLPYLGPIFSIYKYQTPSKHLALGLAGQAAPPACAAGRGRGIGFVNPHVRHPHLATHATRNPMSAARRSGRTPLRQAQRDSKGPSS